MADRFFTDKPLSLGEFILDGSEAHHMGTVRRFVAGDAVVLFNGDGGEYPAEIVAISKRQIVLQLLSREEPVREVPYPIIIGSALPKADRLDFMLEKLVEVGASRFVPLITARSIVNPKSEKIEKWRREVVEASKQCGRNVLMHIDKPMSLAEFLNSTPTYVRLILHTNLKDCPNRMSSQENGRGITLAVGPEGGFTDAEVAAATAAGWQPLSFGPRILRTETAAITAVSWAARSQ